MPDFLRGKHRHTTDNGLFSLLSFQRLTIVESIAYASARCHITMIIGQWDANEIIISMGSHATMNLNRCPDSDPSTKRLR